MANDQDTGPAWRLLLDLLWYGLVGPYRAVWVLGRTALARRETFAAKQLRILLENMGEPAPDPAEGLEELRARVFARLTNDDPEVSPPDVYAAEGWLVLGIRVGYLLHVITAAAVVALTAAAAWRFGQPWAAGRTAEDPLWGGAAVAGAAAAAVVFTGWLALGAGLLAMWGPGRWFMDYCAGRVRYEIYGDAGPPPADAPARADHTSAHATSGPLPPPGNVGH